LTPAKTNYALHQVQKKNPLKNFKALKYLNPYAEVVKKAAKEAHDQGKKKNQELLQQKRGITKRLTAEQKKAKKRHQERLKEMDL
jgi:hypothetical protein